ncbi:MAG: mitochondrial 54S ribosomal protein mrpl1 [Chaenotheca gracillima]|nr:MAG: mitochondrial 54S ribosomal protein mrpl1 [Chaenotheca gracillima]
MSRFYFGGSESSSDLDDDNLPYPKPLPRSSFLTPDFIPTAYLSSLHNRHQTLEDLRSELRARSQELSKELLDLVNTNYHDFLNLGGSLKGGEENVEEVRVGLIGFQRDVESVKLKVDERQEEAGTLIGQRRNLREDIALGRGLLEVSARLDEIESQLMVDSDRRGSTRDEGALQYSDSESDSDDDASEEDGPGAGSISIARLRKLVQQYLYISHLIGQLGSEHPFLVGQESRVTRVRNTLLLDIGTAFKEAKRGGSESHDRLMKVMSLYRDMGEANELIRLLRDTKV